MSRLYMALDQLPPQVCGGGLAIGNFDAVHVGHVALVEQLVALSRQVSGPALVCTFDPPPGAVLFPDRPRIKPLTTLSRRAELFGQLGADGLLAFPTTREFLNLSASDFFDEVIVRRVGARVIVEGPNFCFGRARGGDIDLLGRLCQQAGIRLHVMQLVESGPGVVSSTRIRELVTLGQIDVANQLLLEPYRIEGEVVSGSARGRTIGFPTANLGSTPVLLPALGVYAGRVLGVEPTPWPAAIHIGPNPTFAESEPKVEVHLPGWQGSLYGRTLQVEVLAKVRDVQKFSSVDALKIQLQSDVAQCVRIASEPG